MTGVLRLASGATASVSAPLGYYRLGLEVGYQTVGVSVVNPAIFGAWVQSSSGALVTAKDGAVDVGEMLEQGKAYYLEVVDGPVDGGGSICDPLVTHTNEREGEEDHPWNR